MEKERKKYAVKALIEHSPNERIKRRKGKVNGADTRDSAPAQRRPNSPLSIEAPLSARHLTKHLIASSLPFLPIVFYYS
jgi:hypothetical protein